MTSLKSIGKFVVFLFIVASVMTGGLIAFGDSSLFDNDLTPETPDQSQEIGQSDSQTPLHDDTDSGTTSLSQDRDPATISGEYDPDLGLTGAQDKSISQSLKYLLDDDTRDIGNQIRSGDEEASQQESGSHIEVEIVLSDGASSDDVRSRIANNDGEIIHQQQRVIQASVPPESVTVISQSAYVELVRPIPQPMSMIEDGHQASNVDVSHSNQGLTGDGATIVIIDDEFDPDHPSYSDQVVDIWQRSEQSGIGDSNSHGSQVAKVVGETAPDSDIILAPMSSLTFHEVIERIERSNRDIDLVTMSLGFAPTEQLDGTDSRSQQIAQIKEDQDISWTVSSGNEAGNEVWTGIFESSRSDYLVFDEDEGTTLPLEHTGGSSGEIYVNWDGWDQNSQDGYRVEILSEDGTLLSASNTNLPYESIPVNDEWDDDVYLRIKNVDASGDHEFLVQTTFTSSYSLDKTTREGSITIPGTSPDATTVGAIESVNGTYTAMESWSSRGPTRDGRHGVTVSTANRLNGNSGTSFSAPLVTGVKALMLDSNSNAQPNHLEDAIAQSADSEIEDFDGSATDPSDIGHGGLVADDAIVELSDMDIAQSYDEDSVITESDDSDDISDGDGVILAADDDDDSGNLSNISFGEYAFLLPSGTSPDSTGFYGILQRGTSLFLMTVTTLGVFSLLIVVFMYSTKSLPAPLNWKKYDERVRRYIKGTTAVFLVSSFLYTAIWIATDTQSPPDYLPDHGIFETPMSERIIGFESYADLTGIIDILTVIFDTYRLSVTYVSLAIFIFVVILYVFVRFPTPGNMNFEAVIRSDLYGLLLALSVLPLLYASTWIGTGFEDTSESFSRVAPNVPLPIDGLFSSNPTPVLETYPAKDPLENLILSVLHVQSQAVFMIAFSAFIISIVVYYANSTFLGLNERFNSEKWVRNMLILVFLVAVLPMLLTGATYIFTGVGVASPEWNQNIQGTPFHEEDNFSECHLGEWVEIEESAIPREMDQSSTCEIQLFGGTISRSYNLAGSTPHDEGQVTVNVDGQVNVEIYDDGELVHDEHITDDRRFEVPMTGETTVEISGHNGNAVQSVEAGLTPLPDPMLVVEIVDAPDEIILRDGIQADVRVYNLGSAQMDETELTSVLFGRDYATRDNHTEIEDRLVKTSDGELVEGESYNFQGDTNDFISDNVTVRPIFPGEFERYSIDVQVEPDDDVRPVGQPKGEPSAYLADANRIFNQQEVKGGQWLAWEDHDITITYADLHLAMRNESQVLHQPDLQLNFDNTNYGTAYFPSADTQLDIVRDEYTIANPQTTTGEQVFDNSYNHGDIEAGVTKDIDQAHTFRVPGNYTATIQTNEGIFPEGTEQDQDIEVRGDDVRVDITESNDSVRVGDDLNYTIEVSNYGNEHLLNQDIEMIVEDPDGNVIGTREQHIDQLLIGQTKEFNYSGITFGEVGDHTLHAEAVDPLFPYESYDSVDISGTGPDLQTDVTSNTVRVGADYDVDVNFSSVGSDHTLPTTADIRLGAIGDTEVPDGVDNTTTESVSDVEEDVTFFEDIEDVDIPQLESGDEYSYSPQFEVNTSSEGEFYVEADAYPVEATSVGTFDSSSFDVIDSNLRLETGEEASGINATDENQSHMNTYEITVNNSGSGPANDVAVDVDRVSTSSNTSNPIGTGDHNTTIEFGSIPANSEVTRTYDVSHEDPGDYYARGSIQRLNNTRVDDYEQTWPDMNVTIDPNQYYSTGSPEVDILVENNGTADSTNTSANITMDGVSGSMYDEQHNDWDEIVANDSIVIPPINANEEIEMEVNATLPVLADYNASVTVDDYHPYGGNTDYDNTTRVGTWTEIEADNIGASSNVSSNVTLINEREHNIGGRTAQLNLTNTQTGEIVEQRTIMTPSVDRFDQETFSVFDDYELEQAGSFTVSIDIDEPHWDEPDFAGNQTEDVDDFNVHGPQIELEADSIYLDGELQIESLITNDGDEEIESLEADVQIVEYADEDGELDEKEDADVIIDETIQTPEVMSRETEEFDVLNETSISQEGEYIAHIEVQEDGTWRGQANTATSQFEVVDWFVSGEDTKNTPQSEVSAGISYSSDSPEDVNQARIEIYHPNGDLAEEHSTTFNEDSPSRFVEFVASHRGTHEAYLYDTSGEDDVQVAHDEFSITYPDMSFVAPQVLEYEDTVTLEIPVHNSGDSTTTSLEVDVVGEDEFANPIHEETVEIPELDGGETEVVTTDVTVPRVGKYNFTLVTEHDERYITSDHIGKANHPQEEYSPPPNSENVTFHSSDIRTHIEFTPSESVFLSEAPADVTVSNVGDRNASEKTVTVDTDHGKQATFDIDEELEPGDFVDETVVFNYTDPDHANTQDTASVDVPTPAFSWNDGSEDTVSIIAPELHADITLSHLEENPTRINRDLMWVEIEIRNEGGLTHPPTNGTFRWLNERDRRIDIMEYEIPAIEGGDSIVLTEDDLEGVPEEDRDLLESLIEGVHAGDTHVIEFDYQMYDSCWMSEMSCAPGARIDISDEPVTFPATFNVEADPKFQPTPDIGDKDENGEPITPDDIYEEDVTRDRDTHTFYPDN